MKRQWIKCLVIGCVLCSPLSALAAREPEKDIEFDGRMAGYKDPVRPVEDGGAAAAWSFWILMGLLSIGVLFKSGKRSHLD